MTSFFVVVALVHGLLYPVEKCPALLKNARIKFILKVVCLTVQLIVAMWVVGQEQLCPSIFTLSNIICSYKCFKYFTKILNNKVITRNALKA